MMWWLIYKQVGRLIPLSAVAAAETRTIADGAESDIEIIYHGPAVSGLRGKLKEATERRPNRTEAPESAPKSAMPIRNSADASLRAGPQPSWGNAGPSSGENAAGP